MSRLHSELPQMRSWRWDISVADMSLEQSTSYLQRPYWRMWSITMDTEHLHFASQRNPWKRLRLSDITCSTDHQLITEHRVLHTYLKCPEAGLKPSEAMMNWMFSSVFPCPGYSLLRCRYGNLKNDLIRVSSCWIISIWKLSGWFYTH